MGTLLTKIKPSSIHTDKRISLEGYGREAFRKTMTTIQNIPSDFTSLYEANSASANDSSSPSHAIAHSAAPPITQGKIENSFANPHLSGEHAKPAGKIESASHPYVQKKFGEALDKALPHLPQPIDPNKIYLNEFKLTQGKNGSSKFEIISSKSLTQVLNDAIATGQSPSHTQNRQGLFYSPNEILPRQSVSHNDPGKSEEEQIRINGADAIKAEGVVDKLFQHIKGLNNPLGRNNLSPTQDGRHLPAPSGAAHPVTDYIFQKRPPVIIIDEQPIIKQPTVSIEHRPVAIYEKNPPQSLDLNSVLSKPSTSPIWHSNDSQKPYTPDQQNFIHWYEQHYDSQ